MKRLSEWGSRRTPITLICYFLVSYGDSDGLGAGYCLYGCCCWGCVFGLFVLTILLLLLALELVIVIELVLALAFVLELFCYKFTHYYL